MPSLKHNTTADENAFVEYTPNIPWKKQKKALSPQEKVNSVLKHIQSLSWSISDVLFWSSEWKGSRRSQMHSNAIEKFLSGRCEHHLGEIILNWYTSPDGRVGANEEVAALMWTTGSPEYWKIKHIQASLTSFVAQISISQAVKQAKHAVTADGGLHVRLSTKSDSGSLKNAVHLEWKDIGVDTVTQVGDIIRAKQPFLYALLSRVVAGKPKDQLTAVRKT